MPRRTPFEQLCRGPSPKRDPARPGMARSVPPELTGGTFHSQQLRLCSAWMARPAIINHPEAADPGHRPDYSASLGRRRPGSCPRPNDRAHPLRSTTGFVDGGTGGRPFHALHRRLCLSLRRMPCGTCRPRRGARGRAHRRSARSCVDSNLGQCSESYSAPVSRQRRDVAGPDEQQRLSASPDNQRRVPPPPGSS